MDAEIGRPGSTVAGIEPRAFGRRISTETKATCKTTEFAVYVVVFVGILLASFLVKTGQDGQRPDYFGADKAWWYITLLTIGYMVARGWPSPAAASPTTTTAARCQGCPGQPLGQPIFSVKA